MGAATAEHEVKPAGLADNGCDAAEAATVAEGAGGTAAGVAGRDDGAEGGEWCRPEVYSSFLDALMRALLEHDCVEVNMVSHSVIIPLSLSFTIGRLPFLNSNP